MQNTPHAHGISAGGRHLTVNGVRLWVEDSGGAGPVVLFSHGLLWSTRMFDHQVAALSREYRCVAWDHRGQGRSEVPPPGASLSIEQCYEDTVSLIEQLGVDSVHIVGLSMGGFVAMRLAARRPDLVQSCVLLETSADAEPQENVGRYRLLNVIARWFGLRLVTGRVMPIMFGHTPLHDPARAAERAAWREAMAGNRRDIWRAVEGVITRQSVADELARIVAPTLIMVGDEDTATTPAKAERLHAAIRGSELVRVPQAGHSSTVEQPERVTAILGAWLGRVARGAQPR